MEYNCNMSEKLVILNVPNNLPPLDPGKQKAH